MSTPARRRLMRDFKRLQQDPPAGVSGAPSDNNIMLWNAVIFGPHDTPFEDGTFKLTIEFTEEYPNKPPTVRLRYRIVDLIHLFIYLSADLSVKCSTLMFMLTAVSVLIFFKIVGHLHMMCQPFLRQSSRFLMSPTQILLQTALLLNFIRRTDVNTRSVLLP